MFHIVPYMVGVVRINKGRCVIEERRRHIMRVAGGSTPRKESLRKSTLPSMTILIVENCWGWGLAFS